MSDKPNSNSTEQKLDLTHKVQPSLPVDNWNKLLPYGFIVIDSDGQKYKDVDRGISEVVLDLPPQAISISTHFASSVTATNRGILEENNGVVFRTINITGTTGIFTDRQNVTASALKGRDEVLSRLFPAAYSQIERVSKFSKSIKSLFSKQADNPSGRNALNEKEYKKTGFVRFWVLHNFLVAYAELKKQRGKDSLRLAFVSEKDNIAYFCTPVSFDLKRDASSPLLYRYSITLKCWDVTSAKSLATRSSFNTATDIRSQGYIRMAVGQIQKVRNLINNTTGVLRAIQSDVNDVVIGLNQTMLILKDAVGLVQTAGDFFNVIYANAKIVSEANYDTISEMIDKKKENPGSEPPPTVNSDARVPARAPAVKGPSRRNLSLSSDSASGGSVNGESYGESSGDSSVAESTIDPIMEAYLKSNEMMDETEIDSLTLPPSVQNQIEAQKAEAADITSQDVRGLSEKMQEISDNLMNNYGAMDPDYAKIYGVPVSSGSQSELTEDTIIMASQIQDAKTALRTSLATGLVFPNKSPNPFDDASAVIADEESLMSPLSGIPVFVDRGATLEDIAFKYFKDPAMAREIALTNGLRAPFIDENGFNRPILSAYGRTLIVNSKENLTLNQSITIGASGIAPTRRRILAIESIGNSTFRITVDGNDNLDRYTISLGAFLNARLPGTVGSGDVIIIPSTDAPDEINDTPPTSLLQRLSYSEKVFKIDVAVDEAGDIAIDPSGDVKRSFGYDNAIQAVRLVLNIEEGELNQHPAYGIPKLIGEIQSDLPPEQVIEIVTQKITADPRFADANLNVTVEGTAVRVRVDIIGQGGTGRIPLEFQVGL